MSKGLKSKLLINSVELLPVEGEYSFPTTLLIDEQATYLGSRAIQESTDPTQLNENFKLALGEFKPGRDSRARKRFRTAAGDEKNAFELTKLFLEETVSQARAQVAKINAEPAESILISEPVAFHDHENPEGWISGYRDNLRRVLNPLFENVEFLPEPFAVFQYYRYGKRHPAVVDKKKYFALVIDFGGGTFDISVIETTREGDISQSGKHSKPLSSTSVPVGGFLINRELAIAMIMDTFDDKTSRDEARKQITNHERWKAGSLDLEDLNTRNRNFIKAFERLCRAVETKKIQLTGLINDWRLDSPLKPAISVDVATDPYADELVETSYRLTAEKFREVFITQIFERHLRRAIKSAFAKAEEALKGNPISVCLISGGSANIGWLTKLLEQEFETELKGSTPIQLSENYQHIVSKGLAVECARRKHDPDSEFVSVTYNPVTLLLRSNEGKVEIRKFKSRTEGFEDQDADGLLLPSATALAPFIDSTIRWKVRIASAPRRSLEYFFMNGTLDHKDYKERFNTQFQVFPKQGTRFASALNIELDVKEDGTVVPRFIYNTDREDNPGQFDEGEPFVIDMTAGDSHQVAKAYLGYDFGSSNSSISYVSQNAISTYQERSKDESYLRLNELVQTLPYFISRPLQEYLSCAGDPGREPKLLISALESTLFFIGVVLHSLVRSASSERTTKVAKALILGRRSMGPLSGFLQDALEKAPGNHELTRGFRELRQEKFPELDSAIGKLNDFKHDKAEAQDLSKAKAALEKLLNIANQTLQGWSFGYFEAVEQRRFSEEFEGIFRVANLTTPFYEVFDYRGPKSFSSDRAYLVNREGGEALDLSPLIIWIPESKVDSNSQLCLAFDTYDPKDEELTFTSIGRKQAHTFRTDEPVYDGIAPSLDQHLESDPFSPVHRSLTFSVREDH